MAIQGRWLEGEAEPEATYLEISSNTYCSIYNTIANYGSL